MGHTPWDELEELLVGVAGDDLEANGEVHPALIAFAGGEALFLAFLRSFEKGCYADPIIELLALGMPLGADRYVLSIAGRAWSLEDPIPPVTDGADLRQRVLVLHLVDGPRRWSVLRPFDLVDGRVRWHDPVRNAGAAEGWITEALTVAATRPLQAPPADVRKQARRCVALGHEVHLSEAAERRLATRSSERA